MQIQYRGDISMSVLAMKLGAVDFLPKPFHDQDMLDVVMAAIEPEPVSVRKPKTSASMPSAASSSAALR
jgi:FixJ family two-component response regulator